QLDDCEQALAHCQQALALQREIDDRSSMATTLDSIGYAHYRLDQFDLAEESYRQALQLYRDAGDRYFEADTLVHLGDTHLAARPRPGSAPRATGDNLTPPAPARAGHRVPRPAGPASVGPATTGRSAEAQ